MAFRKSSYTPNEHFNSKHRFEHWYRDNTVYFITSSCRDRFPALRSEKAKEIFWDRFHHYTDRYGFVPWLTSVLDNHYHTIGYLKIGENLGPMMQKIHGSTAKLVNDLLAERRPNFWRKLNHEDYFDGCIRDVLQADRAYRYVQRQSVRHGIVKDWKTYPHTIIKVEKDRAIRRAVDLRALLEEVPYARYDRNPKRQGCFSNPVKPA